MDVDRDWLFGLPVSPAAKLAALALLDDGQAEWVRMPIRRLARLLGRGHAAAERALDDLVDRGVIGRRGGADGLPVEYRLTMRPADGAQSALPMGRSETESAPPVGREVTESALPVGRGRRERPARGAQREIPDAPNAANEGGGRGGMRTGSLPLTADILMPTSVQNFAAAAEETTTANESQSLRQTALSPELEPTGANRPRSRRRAVQNPDPSRYVGDGGLFWDTVDGEFFGVSDELIAEWAEAYPGIEPRRELTNARQWCRANPERRPRSKIRRFIENWMRGAVERLSNRNAQAGGGGRIRRDAPIGPPDRADPHRLTV